MSRWYFITLSFLFALSHCCFAEPVTLRVVERDISVNGKQAKVYGIVQPNGAFGIDLKFGDPFDVRLEDTLQVPTSVHWHGRVRPV